MITVVNKVKFVFVNPSTKCCVFVFQCLLGSAFYWAVPFCQYFFCPVITLYSVPPLSYHLVLGHKVAFTLRDPTKLGHLKTEHPAQKHPIRKYRITLSQYLTGTTKTKENRYGQISSVIVIGPLRCVFFVGGGGPCPSGTCTGARRPCSWPPG